MYEEEYYDEIDESYYEGEPEGNVMLTEEQQKALDKTLEDVKKSMVEDLKKRSLIDYMKEGREVASYKRRKEELENRLKEKENKINDLDYEIRNREYGISIKEKAIAKKEKELQANYDKAIENYAIHVEKSIKELLNDGLGKALKSFTLPKIYTVSNDILPQEKCSLCDENRKRHFTDDQGKTYEIDCPCNQKRYVYKVEDAKLKFNFGFIPSELKDSDTMEDLLAKSITVKSERNYEYSYSEFLKKCFNPKIETAIEYKTRIKYNGKYFTSKEDAQMYCDYIQEIEDKKNKENFTDLKLAEILTYQEEF